MAFLFVLVCKVTNIKTLIATDEEYSGAVHLLLNNGADIHSKNYDGTQPILLAVLTGRKDIVELLISKGADPDFRNAFGDPLLFLALERDFVDCVELLLNSGVDINALSPKGWTPLRLMEAGANK